MQFKPVASSSLKKPETANVNRRTKKFKLETRAPTRHETIVSSIATSDSVYHRGFYLKIGDIVALFDIEDKETVYFAQIRAFLTDQFGQRSAVITWLVPISDQYKRIRYAKDFDSSKFVLGPPEEFPRPLECMEFVCRLEEFNNKKRVDYTNNGSSQYKNDLLQHKFILEDLAKARLRLITRKTFSNDASNVNENQEPIHVDYKIISN